MSFLADNIAFTQKVEQALQLSLVPQVTPRSPDELLKKVKEEDAKTDIQKDAVQKLIDAMPNGADAVLAAWNQEIRYSEKDGAIVIKPYGHDLTAEWEHKQYRRLADYLYTLPMEELRDIEQKVSKTSTIGENVGSRFHIALKMAISKKLFEAMEPIHCTVVFALYKENNRILPKGDAVPNVSHPNGENFIRRKHEQMTWLSSNKADSSWSLLGVDDGCPMDSTGMMKAIYEAEGYKNVRVFKLKDAVKAGSCSNLDNDKLKSEAWDEGDALVKASQKAGAILYGMTLALDEGAQNAGKKHIIAYTDSDLSTDLALSGLNFSTIVNDGCDASCSQRFGEPCSVNCGKEVEGGVAPGMTRSSMVHLSLRHKIRTNLLPPLAPIVDTNCGHKAITAEAVAPTLAKVRDYKGSFDMDWLMCVGICGKAAGRKPIGRTAIPWVESMAESNFWGGGDAEEDPEAAKLKSCTSWHKIFAAMVAMHESHKEDLEKNGDLTDEVKAYVEWIQTLDVQSYMKLTDKILADLEGKEIIMPQQSIMDLTLDQLKEMSK